MMGAGYQIPRDILEYRRIPVCLLSRILPRGIQILFDYFTDTFRAHIGTLQDKEV